jgi:hypothetical protein
MNTRFTSTLFITKAFDVVTVFLARIGEIALFLSTLYVIADVMQPLLLQALHANVYPIASIILSCMPEVVIVIAIITAIEHYKNKNRMGLIIYSALSVLFGVLTTLALFSFVYGSNPTFLTVTLFLRCLASVLFSIVTRVYSMSEDNVTAATTNVTDVTESVTKSVTDVTNNALNVTIPATAVDNDANLDSAYLQLQEQYAMELLAEQEELNNPPTKTEQIKELRRLYPNMANSDIAQQLNCSHTLVSRVTKNMTTVNVTVEEEQEQEQEPALLHAVS